MSHDNKPMNEEVEVELEEVEDGSDIIELTDEEGVVTEFQYLTTIDHDGESYVVLMALEQEEDEHDEDEGEVVILRIDEDDKGEDIYVSFDDEEIGQQVFDKFIQMLEEDDED